MNALRLLDRGDWKPRDPGALDELLRRRGPGGSAGGIRCPRCRWRPRRSDRWACDCGTVWNTFETRGECPGCRKRWQETSCPACHRWSPHEDWYEREGPWRS